MSYEAGQSVGPYRLLFRLGRGGMGEVWAAERGTASKVVALKIADLPSLDARRAGLLADEIRLATFLQHPSIVRTYEVGVDRDSYFMAMELIRGPSLGALLQRLSKRGRVVPPLVVARIGLDVVGALRYAHELERDGRPLELVHRDVSPQNILIDGAGRVFLTDFGIARSSDQQHTTVMGTVIGKPAYMAPEQVMAGEVDARADLFSLGAVLYEACSARRLFGRQTRTASLAAVVRYAPLGLDRLDSTVPRPLSDVIMRLLEKAPTRRYQTAEELERALRPIAESLGSAQDAAGRLAGLLAEEFPSGFGVPSSGLETVDERRDGPPKETLILPAGEPERSVDWPTMIEAEPIAIEEAPGAMLEAPPIEAVIRRVERAPTTPPPPTTSARWTPVIIASVVSAAAAFGLSAAIRPGPEPSISLSPTPSPSATVASASPLPTPAQDEVILRPTPSPTHDPPDPARAIELLEAACRDRVGAACAKLATEASGRGEGNLATDLWSRACELDDVHACDEAATLLTARGDRREALRMSAHGCDELSHASSCASAAALSDQDPRGGLRFGQKGCDLEDAQACVWAEHYAAELDHPAAPEWRRRACRLGVREACSPPPPRPRPD